MERNIGEIFEYNGEWYQCVEFPFSESEYYCDGCSISAAECVNFICNPGAREDNKRVIFKKLEKVGESYSKYVFPRGNVLVQRYKLHIPCDTNVSNGYWIYHWNEKLVDIEIKQNKEDMKEKKDNYDGNMDKECIQICNALNSISDVHTTESCCGHCKDRFMVFFTCDNPHSLAIIARVFDRRYISTSQPWYIELQTKDSGDYDYFIHSETKYDSEIAMMKDVNQIIENIKHWCDDKFASHFKGCDDKPTLAPFDINLAKQGKLVCTRDGRKARIICFDRKDNTPIVALIERVDGIEILQCYHNDGKCFHYETSNNDLMMLLEKKEGWINLPKDTVYFDKKEIAEKNCLQNYSTVKIEWEE